MDKKFTVTVLIRDFFKKSDESLAEFTRSYKSLTERDKLQLASAIARQRNLTPEQLTFEPVEY